MSILRSVLVRFFPATFRGGLHFPFFRVGNRRMTTFKGVEFKNFGRKALKTTVEGVVVGKKKFLIKRRESRENCSLNMQGIENMVLQVKFS